ncbi:MAG TPA: antibiotic biosynthesis monooxygenase family protein [Gaiellaceae bacterium]|nr:antibiotic biosynthesis monooxygenase family protein [Gaiellaceae bacterium]
MTEVYTTGSWKPFPGEEDAFLEAWKEFAGWASGLPGAGRGALARDLRDPERFVSFMAWRDLESVRAWKGSPEFKPRMSRVQKHIDKFAPTELEVVAVVGED